MEDVLFILITISFIFGLVLDLSAFLTYGWFLNKRETEIYMNLDTSKLYLNMFSRNVLMWDTKIGYTYISIHYSLFSKYDIDNVGVVPRWSKLHKRINEYYKIADENNR